MDKEYVFGIDLGGTSIKFGIFENGGKLIEKWSIPTDKSNDGGNIIKNIADEIRKKIDKTGISKKNVLGVGICVPGPVDEKGLVRGCVNLNWGYKMAANELEEILGIKCRALNDANAAGLGEAVYGYGRKYKNVVMVTIGTGVGGAVIKDGRIVTGSRGNAGEIGHFKVNIEETEPCTCGKCGCLEHYASAVGIMSFAKKHMSEYNDSPLNKMSDFQVKDMAYLAEEGDALSLAAFEYAGKYIALGLSYMAGTFDPDIFVIGGGVSLAGEIILEPVRRNFINFAFNTEEETPIEAAVLGNDAGIYGAAEFVMKE